MDKRRGRASGPAGLNEEVPLIEHYFVGRLGEAICTHCGCSADNPTNVLCPASVSLAREREQRLELEEQKAAAEIQKAAAEELKAVTLRWTSFAALVAAAGLVGGVYVLSQQTPAAIGIAPLVGRDSRGWRAQ